MASVEPLRLFLPDETVAPTQPVEGAAAKLVKSSDGSIEIETP